MSTEEQTVGAFLHEKLTNMARWLDAELERADLVQYVSCRSESDIAFLVSVLAKHSPMVAHRDWSGLARLSDIPAQLLDVFQLVRKREDLHDKFWRYLGMFVHVISNEESE